MHLAIDGYVGNQHNLADLEQIRCFLDNYPYSLEMTKICQPVVMHYEATDAVDSGVSGFVMIAESHISIHTFPLKGYINIDIFSCKPFDDRRVLRDVKEYFQLVRVKTWVLERGLEHIENGMASPTTLNPELKINGMSDG